MSPLLRIFSPVTRSSRRRPTLRRLSATFLVVSGLATSGEIKEEYPPVAGSPRRVDLAVPDKTVLVEVKQRVGTHADSSVPDPDNLDQIDGYVGESANLSAVGLLTDGKHWFLRTVADVEGTLRGEPYRFTLDAAADWYGLFEWLQGYVFLKPSIRSCSPENLRREFGPGLAIERTPYRGYQKTVRSCPRQPERPRQAGTLGDAVGGSPR